ncbi:GNAT family N-acetyltransferase [Geodermatophilus sp. URMC 63]
MPPATRKLAAGPCKGAEWCADEARRRGATLVQLTTDERRTDAHRFYERLGYVASHEGFKLEL